MIELMITVTIVAVLATIAVPSMRTYVLNNRLNSAAQEFLRTLQTVRSEAIKRQQSIVVCLSANPLADTAATCTTGTPMPTGWIVFEDDDGDWDHASTEPFVEAHTFDSTKMYVLADNSKRISYDKTGFASVAGTTSATQTPSASVVMCDSRGNVDSNGSTTGAQSVARGVFIAVPGTGRARITKTLADITTLLGAGKINSSCPP